MPTTTKYLWSNGNIIAEADANDTINVVYTYEPQQHGNLISTQISGTPYYHHFDALGSTRQLTNAAGAVTDRMTYDAWGNVISRTGATPISMLWIGEIGYYFDPETGLFQIRERVFGPVIGRWTSADPIGPSSGNFLIYCSNSPLTVFDPSGLDPACSAEFCSTCGPLGNHEGNTYISVNVTIDQGGDCEKSSVAIHIRENFSIYEDGGFKGCGAPATGELIEMFTGGGDLVVGVYDYETGTWHLPTNCTVGRKYVLDVNKCYDFAWDIKCSLACDTTAEYMCVSPARLFGIHTPKMQGGMWTGEYWEFGNFSMWILADTVLTDECCGDVQCTSASVKYGWGGGIPTTEKPIKWDAVKNNCSLKDFPKQTATQVGPNNPGQPGPQYKGARPC